MDVRQFAFLARQPSAAVKHRDTFCGVPKGGLALILANALFWQPLLVQAEGIVVSGPGTTLGGAVAQSLIRANWRGLSSKADFQRLQAEDPFLISMALPDQRPLVTGDTK